MKKLKTILLASLSVFLVSSCSFFDADPEDYVSSDDNYTAKANIYADFMGLMATIQDVADKLIFVAELRGDLIEPTTQAPLEFQNVFNYTATADNSELANPAKYYKIVMNANDFLRNTVEYNAKYPGVIDVNTYRQMIGGAICVRTWAYLTIGKLYGGAVYYDYSMVGEVDLTKLQYLEFDDLIKELIYFMTNGVDRVSGNVNVLMDQIFAVEGVQWRRMSVSPDFLMTELYLWAGDYTAAAKKGINMLLNKGVLGGGDDNRFMLSQFNGAAWANIYRASYSSNHDNEGITAVFYDYRRQQTNDLQRYFDYFQNYWLAPTMVYYNLFGNSNSERLGSTVGLAIGSSEGEISGTLDLVVTKYGASSYNDNFIFIHRAGELHLMIAEALNATGRFDAADSVINYGANGALESGTTATYKYPFNTAIWAHAKTKFLGGVRGRAGEPRMTSMRFLSAEFQAIAKLPEEERLAHPLYQEYYDRRKFVIDSIIGDEAGRELGFEGKRWFTLMRLARNNNNPDILALPVSKKFDSAEQASMLRLLRNKDSWFLDDGIKKYYR